MSEITNYNETWENHTGAEVEQFIKNKLQENAGNISDTTSALETKAGYLEFSKINNTTIQYTLYSDSSKTQQLQQDIFELASFSGYVGTITIRNNTDANIPTILKLGESYEFQYSWEVRDPDERKVIILQPANNNISITVLNENRSISNVYENIAKSGKTSKTDIDLVYSINIPAEYLMEGMNIITFNIEASISGSPILIAPVEFVVYALDPVFTVTVPSNNGLNKLRELNNENDQISLLFRVRDSKGLAIVINNREITPTIFIYYNSDSYYVLTNNSSYTNSLGLLAQSATGSSYRQTGAQKLYMCAKITSGTKTITSNYVFASFICTDTFLSNDLVLFATILNVTRIPSGDPHVKVQQYEQSNFEVYAYSQQSQTINFNYVDNNVSTKLSSDELSANTIKKFILSYTPKKTNSGQSVQLYADNNNYILFILDVESIGSSVNELTGLSLILSSLSKTLGDKTWSYNNYNVSFNGFDWSGNGWINDSLLINNGAVATIPYYPFSTEEFTISFKFLAPNGTYYTLDQNNRKRYEPLIYCNSGNTGFYIYSERAEFSNYGVSVSTEFNSDEIHEITFVRHGLDYNYIMEIFVDGISLCATQAGENNIVLHNAPIIMTASHVLLSVYNVTAFVSGLSFSDIQSLYCFNKTNSTDILNYIEENNVFSDLIEVGDNTRKVTIDSLPVGAIYMVITDFGEEDESPWKTINEYDGTAADVNKKIRHAVGNIKLIQKTEGNVPHPRNFCVDRGTLSAQGTSSMAYPLKNFRIYFKKTINSSLPYYNATMWHDGGKAGDACYSNVMYTNITPDFYIDNNVNNLEYTVKNSQPTDKKEKKPKYSLFSKSYGDSYTSAPATIFCLKADYAESSGSHNTGFARMANFALTQSSHICPELETSSLMPLYEAVVQQGSNAKYKYDIRSTVDGFPVYLFFKNKNTDKDSEAIYHGKYNLNNEKSSENVFGFNDIHDYFSNAIVLQESEHLKQLFNDVNSYFDITHDKYGINNDGEYDDKDSTYVNPTECWEFSNNTFTVSPTLLNVIGAFQFPYTPDSSWPKFADYGGLDPFTVKDDLNNLAWLSQAWEYRYPDIDDDSAADVLYKNGTCRPFLLDSLYKFLYKHNFTLTRNYSSLNEFAANLHLYFNINYLLKYFVLTKWFGNVDQRIKNCMLSFYCDPNAIDNTGSGSGNFPMGHMRAFYIFYDNDTILGVDNAGSLTLDWDIDEDVYPGAGKHAIWDNLEECYKAYVNKNTSYNSTYRLGKLIEDAYISLRAVLTDNRIQQFLVDSQEGKFPGSIHNIDAEVKYFYPSNLNSHVTDPLSLNKFQGNRHYHRKRWLTKRTNWMDAKFGTGNYSKYSYAFKVGGTSGNYQEGGTIKVTSALKDWRFFIINTTGATLASTSLVGVDETKSLNVASNTFSISDFVTIGALYGCKKLDFSDYVVSTWFEDLKSGGMIMPYMETFILNKETSVIKKFKSQMMSKLLISGDLILFPNLKELYLCNLAIYATSENERLDDLDLSKFSNLEYINATGSDLDIILPLSNNLRTLILQSPHSLSIANKTNISISVLDTSNLNTITAGRGNSIEVYNQVINLINNRISDLNFIKAELEFGDKDDYYSITSEQLDAIISLGTSYHSSGKISVKGYIYKSDLTSQQIEILTDLYGEALHCSNSITSDLTFILPTEIREGQTITITCNHTLSNASDWVITNPYPNEIIVDPHLSYVNITVLPQDDNISKENTISFYVNYGGQQWHGENIRVRYIGINGFSIESSVNLVSYESDINLTLNYFPSDHTKSAWLQLTDRISVDANSNGDINVINENTLRYRHTSSENDANIQVTIGNMVQYKNLPYNKTVLKPSDVSELINCESNNTDNAEYWIYELLLNTYGRTRVQSDFQNNGVKISDLLNISLLGNWSDNLSKLYGQEGAYRIFNLSKLKYFSYNGSDFTIPLNVLFSDVELPSGNITNVNITIYPDNYGGINRYGKIVFPSSVVRATVTITTSYLLPFLKFDLSLTHITKIHFNPNTTETNSFNLNYNYIGEALAQGIADNTSYLFDLPSTVSSVGNYLPIGSLAILLDYVTRGMFEYSNISTSNGPLYKKFSGTDDISTIVELGLLSNKMFNSSGEGTLFNINPSYIQRTYASFMYGIHLPKINNTTFLFSSIKSIGNFTFYKCEKPNKTFQLNEKVEEIGVHAFSAFDGIIETNSGAFTNDRLTIKNYAFYMLKSSQEFHFNNKDLLEVGADAFLPLNNNVYHNIYFDANKAFSMEPTSFGDSTHQKNVLHMSIELYNIMYLDSTFKNAKDNNWFIVDTTYNPPQNN